MREAGTDSEKHFTFGQAVLMADFFSFSSSPFSSAILYLAISLSIILSLNRIGVEKGGVKTLKGCPYQMLAETLGFSHTANGKVKWHKHFGKVWWFLTH